MKGKLDDKLDRPMFDSYKGGWLILYTRVIMKITFECDTKLLRKVNQIF